ncbi:ASCH domain-containing protein [Promicromonospora sukumoe]|uniref:ASCH domain-containing protein n=1 Tax=Promicromonospora sukumoe TaxID=88382 RepID=UPI00037FC93C|nr:ASCH domain-containing protein [Promicromonospora sukumoe]
MTTATGPALTATEQRLIDAALEVVSRLPEDGSYLNTVASAVMDVHGDIYTGANVGHFTGGPCAELVALGTAAAGGAGPIALIVAVGDEGRGVIGPCGRCRQVLLDQQPDCHVIVSDGDEPFSVPARDLLPHSYQHPDADPPRLLWFSPQHWTSVSDGGKTATTRFNDPAAPGPTTLLFEFDDRFELLPGVVDSVERVRFGGITDAQAALEGCTADELRTALRTYYYPDVTDDDLVDFVRFRTGEPS